MLLGTGYLVRSMAATEPPIETDSGEFIHAIADNFQTGKEENAYSLRQSDGQYLDVTIDPTKAGKTPRTGSKVHIHGRRQGKHLAVTNEAAASIVVDAQPSSDSAVLGQAQLSQPDPGAQGSTAPAGSSVRAYNRAVILVNLNDPTGSAAIGLKPQMRTTAEETGYLSGSMSPDTFWSETSYGQLSLTSKVVGSVTINISSSDCSLATIHGWADAADAAVRAAGTSLSGYTNFTYILPFDPAVSGSSSCAWGGYSDMGGQRTWLAYGYAAFNSGGGFTRYLMGTESHEFGHNLGLLHSASYTCTSNAQKVVLSNACSVNTYGDPWDLMGSQDYYHLLDSYHREQLGFIPSAKIQTISTSGNYTIASSDIDPATTALPQSIRIARPGAQPAQFYELETRSPSGTMFDNFSTSQKVAMGFTLRVIPAIRTTDLDYSYLLNSQPDDTSGVAAPFYDETFTDPASGLSIKLLNRTASTITVAITLNGVAPPAGASDNIYPTVLVASPKEGSSYAVGAAVPLTATAYDNTNVSKVSFYDGSTLLGSVGAPPYTFSWNTKSVAGGSHTIKIAATDPTGNIGYSTVTVTLTGGTTPPPPVVAPPSTTKPGDANGDNKVNLLDYSVLYSHQKDTPIYGPIDFNHDGQINGADLNILLTHWSG